MPESYREVAPPPALAGYVRCVWWATSPGPEAILPDGCLDLIVAGSEVFVAGPDTGAWSSTVAAGVPLYGVRFQPGRAPGVLAVPADELRDQRVFVDDLWGRHGRRVTERLVAEPEHSLRVVADAVDRGRRVPDTAVDEAVRRLRNGETLAMIRRDLGVSERQLRRRFEAAVGYGPTLYRRVERMQRAREIRRRWPGRTLADVAVEAGYSDQQHLARDTRSLTGMTPTQLL